MTDDDEGRAASGSDPTRVAVLSLHTSPLQQPGEGDSGGMNVYVMAVAERLAEQGIRVDVYTRQDGNDRPEVEELTGGGRLIQIEAGPRAPVAKEQLPTVLTELMRDIGIPNGIGAVGYTESDIPDLVPGTMKQQRLLATAPREVTEEDVAGILARSLELW